MLVFEGNVAALLLETQTPNVLCLEFAVYHLVLMKTSQISNALRRSVPCIRNAFRRTVLVFCISEILCLYSKLY